MSATAPRPRLELVFFLPVEIDLELLRVGRSAEICRSRRRDESVIVDRRVAEEIDAPFVRQSKKRGSYSPLSSIDDSSELLLL